MSVWSLSASIQVLLLTDHDVDRFLATICRLGDVIKASSGLQVSATPSFVKSFIRKTTNNDVLIDDEKLQNNAVMSRRVATAITGV